MSVPCMIMIDSYRKKVVIKQGNKINGCVRRSVVYLYRGALWIMQGVPRSAGHTWRQNDTTFSVVVNGRNVCVFDIHRTVNRGILF